MIVPVVSYEDLKTYAVDTIFPTAKWIALGIIRASFRIALSAQRMLKPRTTSPRLSVESATLYFDDGKAIELPNDQATNIIEHGDAAWLDDVDERDAPTLEIRYVLRGKKFRAIAKRGVKFPTLEEACGNVSAPKILSATLVSSPEGDTHLDITDRVLKYMGPRGDWHGASVKVRDMFPNHDAEQLETRGYDIVVIDNRLHTTITPFKEDTVISDIVPSKRT